jgi:hypothetical protein
MPTEIAEIQELSEEGRRVRDWRRQQFESLGFSGAHAEILAECRDVDLGRVRSMVAAGCGLGTVLQIVL